MAISMVSAAAVCSICGEPLNAKGECVACLLRTGLDDLARDNVLRRKVALKVIEVPAARTGRESQAVRERFLREARAAPALRHPNVAAVFQFGASPDGSRCYYAMELVEGETLETRVRRDGPLNAKI